MRWRKYILMGLALAATMPWNAAAGGIAILDVEARKKELAQPEFAAAREACLAIAPDSLQPLPEPISALEPTEAYGTDNRAEPFAWAVMVLSGRALAGDQAATTELIRLLDRWAKADALEQSPESYDTYYALKRVMLPTVGAYAIVYEDMSDDERDAVEPWIDGLVRRLDTKFDGDVDRNNHRYLADSVLMAWGNFTGDRTLYKKGIARFEEALRQAGADGSLPLETRRGARATWYMRQALASLTLMAEIARLDGDDLYRLELDGKSLDLILTYYLNAVNNPLIILPDAAENYIPGPSADYMAQDRGMLERRSQNRHYMAFAELYLRHYGASFPAARLQVLMERTGFKERPLMDDFVGGNATCFWWRPEVKNEK